MRLPVRVVTGIDDGWEAVGCEIEPVPILVQGHWGQPSSVADPGDLIWGVAYPKITGCAGGGGKGTWNGCLLPIPSCCRVIQFTTGTFQSSVSLRHVSSHFPLVDIGFTVRVIISWSWIQKQVPDQYLCWTSTVAGPRTKTSIRIVIYKNNF